MQAINFMQDTFDRNNTFVIEIVKPRRTIRVDAGLYRDYQKQGDGIIWAMKRSATLQASYSEEQLQERARLNAMEPVRNGDTVLIDGRLYKARVLGDSSDCAIFDPA